VFLCTVLAVFVLTAVGCQQPAPLPTFAAVPAFELTAQNGRRVSSEDFDGQVWIADFIFTNCAGPCSLLTSHMARVQQYLVDENLDIPLISFSVDPDHDTPQVLTEYGETFHADFDRWTFLTGEKQAIYNLILGGFKLAVRDGAISPDGTPGPGIITHSTRFALIDQEGNVRGYYYGEEPDVAQKIVPDAMRLLTEGS
jgi:protein SCO1/2